MKRRILKKILIAFLSLIIIILICVGIFLIDGFVEKSKVDELIESFVNRGVYVYETEDKENGYTYIRKYYEVYKEYDYEEVNDTDRFVFDYQDSYKFIGAKTDVILTNRNPMRDTPYEKFIGFFAKNFYLGHASINVADSMRLDKKETVEVVGKGDDDKVRYWPNDWFYDAPAAPDIICLRLKNTTSEIRNNICEKVESLIGTPYNYTFAFNTKNTYYCTDLISRPLKEFGYDLNEDSFFTLGNDLIVSEDVYFVFYRVETREEKIVTQKIYYLSEE